MNVERSKLTTKEANYYDNNDESDIENTDHVKNDNIEGITFWDGTCLYHTNYRSGIWKLNKQKPDYTISISGNGYGYYIDSKLPSLSISIIPPSVADVIAEFIGEKTLKKQIVSLG